MVKWKKLLLTLCIGLQLSTVPVATVRADSVFTIATGICWDIASVVGSICKGILGLGVVAHETVKEYGTKNHVYAAAVVIAGVCAYNYAYVIKEIENKYGKSSGKIAVWDTEDRKFVNHTSIQYDSDNFLTEFNSDGKIRALIAAGTLITTIDQGIVEINEDLEKLEKQFLVFFNFFEINPTFMKNWGLKPRGIKENFKSIVKRFAPITKDKPSEFWWDQTQFGQIDKEMDEESTRLWHAMCLTLNYGNAAEVWWKLKKMEMRLKVIKAKLVPAFAGLTNIPFHTRSLSSVSADARLRSH